MKDRSANARAEKAAYRLAHWRVHLIYDTLAEFFEMVLQPNEALLIE